MPFLPRPQKLKGMVGDKGFDPLGLSDWVPVEWLRESELKHGRVCMLAVVGFVATDLGFRLPGEMHQVASINAHDMAVDMGAMTQIGIWIAVAECIGYLAILDRRPPTLSAEEQRVHKAVFPSMEPRAVRKLFDLGQWENGLPPSLLVQGGAVSPRVWMVAEGAITVRRDEEMIREIAVGDFVGEASFLSRKPMFPQICKQKLGR